MGRAGLSHSAVLFQLSAHPLFLFSSFPPLPSLSLPFASLPRPVAATPPSFSLLPLRPLLFPFRPSISVTSGTPYIQLGGMGERCELPQRGLGRNNSQN